MKSKKLAIISSVCGAVIMAGSLAVPVFAASNSEDDTDSYSYNIGQSAYAERQAEYGYSDEDTITNDSYSFNTGRQENAERKSIYAELPANATDEELEAFYESHDVGNSSAYVDGKYDETAKEGYSYNQGYSSYQQWHSALGND